MGPTRTLAAVAAVLVAMVTACGPEAPANGGSAATTTPASPTYPAGSTVATVLHGTPATTVVPSSVSSPPEPPTSPPPSTMPALDTRPPTTPETTMHPPSHPLPTAIETALADLSSRAGVAVDAIEVVSVEEVTWPDGSLGCPEPGMAYTQALVNGTRILLRSGGYEYEYHSGRGGDPFYCPPDRVTAPATGTDPSI